ncbi:MAG: FAD:protein FMN transferase [Thermoanaerobaculia bacterium]
MTRTTAVIVALALFVSLDVRAAQTSRARYLMGTVCEVAILETGADPSEIEVAFAEAARIEEMLSTWRESSELSRLNGQGTAQVSPETAALLYTAMEWARKTDSAFNPLIRPLVDAWKTRGEGAFPTREAVDAARPKLRLENVVIDGVTVTLRNGARFEEGGFGKGYAIDRMLAGLSATRAMVNFGGQIGVKGAMRVSIADPRDRTRAIAEMTIADGSISTSSGSEKTFTLGGREFSHILDPRTGEALPSRGSVSVVATSATETDILSTALYVMGEADGLRWADANGVAALFVTDTTIRRSAAFREHVRDLAVLDRKYTIED